MDKLTRLLLLHSRLTKGGKINKLAFCMECEINPRTFDRDIEDIRLYLSDSFSNENLIYDRKTNEYYIENCLPENKLEAVEFSLIKRILIDSNALRKDEMEGLLYHLFNITHVSNNSLLNELMNDLELYKEPVHKKALIKMYGDLSICIRKKYVIKLHYHKSNGEEILRDVFPCSLRYDSGYIYLSAFRCDIEAQYPAFFRIDRIYSFEILRSQSTSESIKVIKYNEKYFKNIIGMYGGEYTKIKLWCKNNILEYVENTFTDILDIEKKENGSIVTLNAFEDGFVKWLSKYSVEDIYVLKPLHLINRIKYEAINVINKYETEEK